LSQTLSAVFAPHSARCIAGVTPGKPVTFLSRNHAPTSLTGAISRLIFTVTTRFAGCRKVMLLGEVPLGKARDEPQTVDLYSDGTLR